MRFSCILIILLFSSAFVEAQVLDSNQNGDRKYLEDQFYFGLTYNFATELPIGVSQRNLSYGLQGGFIKDIPLSYDRTFGLGIGLGYGINSYYTNLLASQQGTELEYTILDSDADFKRNKIATHVLELPFQFRWRNSTPQEYKFWRIYTGIKMGYVFDGRSKYVSSTEKIVLVNKDIRDFQYGLTLNVGYNTFNIHIYYALSSLFNDGIMVQSGEAIEYKPLKVGLIFYIL
ncbi:PorT family protein [Arenibacter sp. N53]|uniref:porin family protein n=1 Tax=Arenibacter TaxID=178469 RepID=UPI000CD42080|nr:MULTISPECIES: porin family protein [Arenibacter]MCM4152857.1 PorT family protein [Arenibacter sp. N53]